MDRFVRWLPAFILMAIIFSISSAPGSAINSAGLGDESLHRVGHFLLFFFLCIAFYKATKGTIESSILTIFYGVTDEIHQMFTPFRSPSFFDIKVDALGAVLAALLIWKLSYLLPKKLKNWLEN